MISQDAKATKGFKLKKKSKSWRYFTLHQTKTNCSKGLQIEDTKQIILTTYNSLSLSSRFSNQVPLIHTTPISLHWISKALQAKTHLINRTPLPNTKPCTAVSRIGERKTRKLESLWMQRALLSEKGCKMEWRKANSTKVCKE